MDLKNIRKEIDTIDDQIADLINKRMEIVKGVAEYKRQTGMGIADKQRETEILTRICTGENDDYLRLIFGAIFDSSRSYQSRLLDNENALC
jgi:monofunctional chorismate mutase